MINVVPITLESINYLILVSSQNSPETAEWLIRMRDLFPDRLVEEPMFMAKDQPSFFEGPVVSYMTYDKRFIENHADKYRIVAYLY